MWDVSKSQDINTTSVLNRVTLEVFVDNVRLNFPVSAAVFTVWLPNFLMNRLGRLVMRQPLRI